MKNFQSLLIAVSGGLHRLGLDTTLQFASKGCQVIILDKEPSDKAVLDNLPKKCHFIPTDVGDSDSVKNSFNKISNQYETLNVLINCSSMHYLKKLYTEKFDEDLDSDLDRIIKTNVFGNFYLMKEACALFRKNKPNSDGERGVIINSISQSAIDGQCSQVLCAASYASILGMLLPASRELSKDGIRVTGVMPGLFGDNSSNFLSQRIFDSLLEFVNFPKRYGTPTEFVHALEMIIENPMINGEVIRVDAGLRLPTGS